jgi:hypothetical protein
MNKLVVAIVAIGSSTAASAQAALEFATLDPYANGNVFSDRGQRAFTGLTSEQYANAR